MKSFKLGNGLANLSNISTAGTKTQVTNDVIDDNLEMYLECGKQNKYPIQYRSHFNDISIVNKWSDQTKYAVYQDIMNKLFENSTSKSYKDFKDILFTNTNYSQNFNDQGGIVRPDYKKIFEDLKPYILLHLITNSINEYEISNLDNGKYIYTDGSPIMNMLSIAFAVTYSSDRYCSVIINDDEAMHAVITICDTLQNVGYVNQDLTSIRVRSVTDCRSLKQYPTADILNDTNVLFITPKKALLDIPFVIKRTDKHGKLVNRTLFFYNMPTDSIVDIPMYDVDYDICRRMLLDVDIYKSINDSKEDFEAKVFKTLIKYAREDLINQRDIFYKISSCEKYDVDDDVIMFLRSTRNKLSKLGINANDFRSNNKVVTSVVRVATYGMYILSTMRSRFIEARSYVENKELSDNSLINKIVKKPVRIFLLRDCDNNMMIFDPFLKVSTRHKNSIYTVITNDRIAKFEDKSEIEISDVVKHPNSGIYSVTAIVSDDHTVNANLVQEHVDRRDNTVKDIVKCVEDNIDNTDGNSILVISSSQSALEIDLRYCSYYDQVKKGALDVTASYLEMNETLKNSAIMAGGKLHDNPKTLVSVIKDYGAYEELRRKYIEEINQYNEEFGEEPIETNITKKNDSKMTFIYGSNVENDCKNAITHYYVETKNDFNMAAIAIRKISFADYYTTDFNTYCKRFSTIYIATPPEISNAEFKRFKEDFDCDEVSIETCQAAKIKKIIDRVPKTKNFSLHYSGLVDTKIIDELFQLYENVYVNGTKVITTDDAENLPKMFEENTKKKISDYRELVSDVAIPQLLGNADRSVTIELKDAEAFPITEGGVVKRSKYSEAFERLSNYAEDSGFLICKRITRNTVKFELQNTRYYNSKSEKLSSLIRSKYYDIDLIEDSYPNKKEMTKTYNAVKSIILQGTNYKPTLEGIRLIEKLQIMSTCNLKNMMREYNKRMRFIIDANDKARKEYRRDDCRGTLVLPYPNQDLEMSIIRAFLIIIDEILISRANRLGKTNYNVNLTLMYDNDIEPDDEKVIDDTNFDVEEMYQLIHYLGSCIIRETCGDDFNSKEFVSTFYDSNEGTTKITSSIRKLPKDDLFVNKDGYELPDKDGYEVDPPDPENVYVGITLAQIIRQKYGKTAIELDYYDSIEIDPETGEIYEYENTSYDNKPFKRKDKVTLLPDGSIIVNGDLIKNDKLHDEEYTKLLLQRGIIDSIFEEESIDYTVGTYNNRNNVFDILARVVNATQCRIYDTIIKEISITYSYAMHINPLRRHKKRSRNSNNKYKLTA